jgi:hypothetical protein
MLPSVPDSASQLLVVLGVALIVAGVQSTTKSWDDYQISRADTIKQVGLLSVEERYLDQATDQLAKQKEIDAKRIEIAWFATRENDLHLAWRKYTFWSFFGVSLGLALTIVGLTLWVRKEYESLRRKRAQALRATRMRALRVKGSRTGVASAH